MFDMQFVVGFVIGMVFTAFIAAILSPSHLKSYIANQNLIDRSILICKHYDLKLQSYSKHTVLCEGGLYIRDADKVYEVLINKKVV